MSTEPAKEIKPRAVPAAAERLKAAFVLALGGLLVVVLTIFLPHLLLGVVLFALSFYAVHQLFISLLAAPFSWIAGGLFFVGYGLVAMLYALAASVVFALRSAAVNIEDFLYMVFASLKDKGIACPEPVKTFWGGVELLVTDPDGNTILYV